MIPWSNGPRCLSYKEEMKVRFLPGLLKGLQVLWQHASLVSEEDWVRFPGGPLHDDCWGRMYRGGEVALQANWEGFDSLRLHSGERGA